MRDGSEWDIPYLRAVKLPNGSLPSTVGSFIAQAFLEHLLWARPLRQPQGYSSELTDGCPGRIIPQLPHITEAQARAKGGSLAPSLTGYQHPRSDRDSSLQTNPSPNDHLWLLLLLDKMLRT